MPVHSSTPVSLREAVARVVAALDAPVSRQELVHRVLAIHPSQARRPNDLIMAEVRQHTDLVRLDDGRLAPPDWILRGIRFRYTPTAREAANGIVPFFPCFVPFFLESDAPDAITPVATPMLTLLDEGTGERIAWQPFDLHGSLLRDDERANPIHFHALNLRAWFMAHAFAPGDSLLLTVEDPKQAVFRLAFEAAAESDPATIAIQDATLESVLFGLVQKRGTDQPFIEDIVPAALARLHAAAREYPGSHWHAVVSRSSRLRLVDDYAIARATFRRPIDRIFGYAVTPAAEKNLEARIDAFNGDLNRVLRAIDPNLRGPGMQSNPCGRDEALHRSSRQISLFLAQAGGPITEDRFRCLAVPSVYLAKHEGVPLAEADFGMLCRFLLSYYPRRVLHNHKAFTARMLGALRHFYAAQAEAGMTGAAALPHKLSRLHALVDRKIALLGEIDLDAPYSARLFTKLFPEIDKDDAEMLTLTLRGSLPLGRD